MGDLVSVIIPTYNRAALLVRALASVAAQDYRPIEAIVIDDGSTDGTPQIVDAQKQMLASRGIETQFLQQENAGAPKARNTGITSARGEIIAFLDSDDLWRPTFLSTVAPLLVKYPSAGLAFCGILGIDPDDQVFAERELGLPKAPEEGLLARPFELILRHMPTQTSGVVLRRGVLRDVGLFDLEIPVCEDWDLWYRISKKYDFAYTTQPLACNRMHPNNLPKRDVRSLTSSLKMNLRNLPDIASPEVRELMVKRIRHEMTLLREDLLRQGMSVNGHRWLLDNELSPRNLRTTLGAIAGRCPRWVGRGYARLVRAAGNAKRSRTED